MADKDKEQAYQKTREEIIKHTGTAEEIKTAHDSGIRNAVNIAVGTGLITEAELAKQAEAMRKADEEASNEK